MKILQVNKYLYRKAGAEAYLFDVADLLASHGHEVALWGTDEKVKNEIRQPAERMLEPLVGAMNFDKREGIVRDLKKFGHMIWSTEAARKFEVVLKRFRPDVIHIHNIYHHLSPSILSVARCHKIPVVMTVHDYKLINPNYSLYDHGTVCERDNLPAISHRCIQNSYLATFADVIEMTIHRIGGFYRRGIKHFLVPALFAKEKLAQHGIPSSSMTVLPLPVRSARLQSRPIDATASPYILFAGRLAASKGVDVLLHVAKHLRDIPFKIAGTGPETKNVELRIKQSELKNVELLGFVQKEKLQKVIAGARLVVVPSQWYEVSPFAVLEPMAQGKAVMASNLGGMTNLIEEGKTGFLVDALRVIASETKQSQRSPRSLHSLAMTVEAWVDAIQNVYYDEKLLKRVGEAGRSYIERVHDPERHYEALMEIYEKVLRQ